jgi:hypothetical protein
MRAKDEQFILLHEMGNSYVHPKPLAQGFPPAAAK